MRDEIIKAILEHKIIAISRGVPAEYLPDTARALYKGGIRLMEVTYEHKSGGRPYDETDSAIRALIRTVESDMYIGAGTVINDECLSRAYSAGAKFIISPDANARIISKTRDLGLVSIPGALTPTEIVAASAAGADFVKVFPAGDMGAGYIKAVSAPLSHINLLAVGGVNARNARAFLDAGAKGLGIASTLINAGLIMSGEFSEIESAARETVKAIQ